MPHPLTRALRLTALATPLFWTVAAPSTALATTPVGWEEPPSISTLTALLLFVGVPLGLFLLIVGLTVAPSLARRGDQQQNVDRWATPQWFNGPAAGAGGRAVSASGTAGNDARALEATSTGTGATAAAGSGSASRSGASVYTASGGGHRSGSSAYAASGQRSGSSAYAASGQRSGSSAYPSPRQGSSTYAGRSVGAESSTYATPGADAAGSKAHMMSGNAPEAGTSDAYASPGSGVPAEGDQLAAAATRGGGASARW